MPGNRLRLGIAPQAPKMCSVKPFQKKGLRRIAQPWSQRKPPLPIAISVAAVEAQFASKSLAV
jgi:hypothetical protein